MKRFWGQPSLFRDFALLSAVVIFVLLLISSLVAYTTYARFSAHILSDLEKESLRIERTLAGEMQDANYMLTALGRQIIVDPDRDLVKLAHVLKSFDNAGYIYSIFSWVSTEQQVVVSSNRGVLDKPVDISDRDYVKKAMADPWKMQIGRPIEGRVSGRWVIPVAMGLTDYTGKFIGTIMISIDINTLTEKISNLVRRDGLGFAIVSKTLLTLTQVSDDKDFVSNNFPNQKLINVNFSNNPSGVITQGNLFFSTNTYSYYRVSPEYPYIILLSYDSRYSTETLHSMLLSRMLQFLAISALFVLFLWVMRTRIITPVQRLTHMASAIARGEGGVPSLSLRGPEEIRELSLQLSRISEYMDEMRRIEDELRNKLFLTRKNKESAELALRAKTEFLAYASQEMRSPLNNIVGFAQVMRDQLYGPIENRKYRQYASDIYQSGNALLNQLQDLLTLSKVETDYIELSEKPVDVQSVVSKVLRFLADRLQSEKLSVKVKMQEPMPKLVADEFRLQQILMNSLLYATKFVLQESTLSLEALIVNENRDRQYLVIAVHSDEKQVYSPSELALMAGQAMKASPYYAHVVQEESTEEKTDLSLELARSLVALHDGYFSVQRSSEGVVSIIVFFAGNRIRFNENKDSA